VVRTQREDASAPDDPESLALASDRARSEGDDRTAAHLRLRLLRVLLATRDQLTSLVDLAGPDRARGVRELEDDLIEHLIRPGAEAGDLAPRVRAVLDAEATVIAGIAGSSC
jgi:hypothetical protein